MVERGDETAREAEGAGTEPGAFAGAFRVALPPFRPGEPPFEGPLDLLLHLVKEHEVEIFDIPIARITEAYLETLAAMRELDIDVAGEFLHMAAQLMLLKSRLLAVYGTWQREGEVKNLIAGRLEDLTPLLGRLATESRDFK